ncbi:hypothetical protein [Ponticaulis sp.]|uniref:hypothetical protein n=1 Tax=Ponticaulis sp. TaxID=2020902 RepID=UPI0025E298CB|nr:hypothetical protein [Ponticaulis sp.]|tara:strand:+ start:2309 stop:2467 length:159 start_codon:yes stop_codon:yes gene_type:complete
MSSNNKDWNAGFNGQNAPVGNSGEANHYYQLGAQARQQAYEAQMKKAWGSGS